MVESLPKHQQKRAFAFIGPRGSGKSTHAICLQETIRGQKLEGKNALPYLSDQLVASRTLIPDNLFIPAMQTMLDNAEKSRLVVDNIPRTKPQAEALADWSERSGYHLHTIAFDLSEDEVVDRAETRLICSCCGESYHYVLKPPQTVGVCDKDGSALIRRRGDNGHQAREAFRKYSEVSESILDHLKMRGTFVHRIEATGTIEEASRRLYQELGGFIFQEAGMPAGYYSLRALGSEHMFIAGMSTFIHDEGAEYFKDFDILVPDQKIDEIAEKRGEYVSEKVSSHASTKSVYMGDSVEVVSDLVVKVGEQEVPFSYDFLKEEAVSRRFMGLHCSFMGIEDLMLLYAALGRQGKDYYGKEKHDLTNLARLAAKPTVNWEKLEQRAKRLGMLNRLQAKLEEVRIAV